VILSKPGCGGNRSGRGVDATRRHAPASCRITCRYLPAAERQPGSGVFRSGP
jgi:hypothetical protein